MTASNMIQEMSKHAILVVVAINHSELEIASFLKVTRSFMFKVRNDLETSG